ncbi:MAG: ORF6N domain-containing protein [Elusimicrobiota bacterium]
MNIEGPVIKIKGNIFHVRGKKVVPAADAAAFYEVTPAALIRAVRRNPRKFTRECMFRLNRREQSVIPAFKAKKNPVLVFTEMGVSMLSTVLRNSKAVAVHVQIVRETVATMGNIFDLFKPENIR